MCSRGAGSIELMLKEIGHEIEYRSKGQNGSEMACSTGVMS